MKLDLVGQEVFTQRISRWAWRFE